MPGRVLAPPPACRRCRAFPEDADEGHWHLLLPERVAVDGTLKAAISLVEDAQRVVPPVRAREFPGIVLVAVCPGLEFAEQVRCVMVVRGSQGKKEEEEEEEEMASARLVPRRGAG